MWNVRYDSSIILSYAFNYFTFYVIKGIKMVVRILWETEALSVFPWQATSLYSLTARAESQTKAQPCGHLKFTMHGKHF